MSLISCKMATFCAPYLKVIIYKDVNVEPVVKCFYTVILILDQHSLMTCKWLCNQGCAQNIHLIIY